MQNKWHLCRGSCMHATECSSKLLDSLSVLRCFGRCFGRIQWTQIENLLINTLKNYVPPGEMSTQPQPMLAFTVFLEGWIMGNVMPSRSSL